MARTKEVFKSSRGDRELYHLWANGRLPDYARGSTGNVYVRYSTIYSYGDHFPMARLWNSPALGKEIAFFTKQTYSNTTAKHLNYTRSAIHQEVIECWVVPTLDDPRNEGRAHTANIQGWTSLIAGIAKQLANPRNRNIAERVSNIQRARREAERYIQALEITLTDEQHEALYGFDLDNLSEALARLAERNAERQRKEKEEFERRHARALEMIPAYIDAFHNYFEPEHLKNLSDEDKKLLKEFLNADRAQYLRTDGELVSTSLGVNIPVAVAERSWRWYMRIAAKGCDGNCNHKVAGYEVKEATSELLVVGCHRIPRTEINYIANKLNWTI